MISWSIWFSSQPLCYNPVKLLVIYERFVNVPEGKKVRCLSIIYAFKSPLFSTRDLIIKSPQKTHSEAMRSSNSPWAWHKEVVSKSPIFLPVSFIWLSSYQLSHFPSQVPSTCSALLGRAVLLSRLPPSPYIYVLTRTLILAQRFCQHQLSVGVSTSGHFYLCWMLPLPSWNWPAGAVAQPTCGRSSWKVKVKTRAEIEKNTWLFVGIWVQPALSWSWKMWHHRFREATRVELVLGTKLSMNAWLPDFQLKLNMCCEEIFWCACNISMSKNRSPCKRKDRKVWIWEHHHISNICQSPWNLK